MPSDQLNLRLLGRFSIQRGGAVVLDATWRRRKAAAVIKILALQPGRSMNRHRLAGMLWPDADEASAANNLHKALHFIRREVDGGLVSLEGANVTLTADAVLDIDEFRRLVAASRNGTSSAATLEEALSVYRGVLLPEDLYEPWAEAERERLGDQSRGARIALAQMRAAEGNHASAIETLIPLALDEPSDEDVQQELMQLYALVGDRRSALRVYDALRDALYDDLGIAPSEEVRALREQIAAGTFEGLAVATAPSRLDIRHVYSTDGTRIAYTSIGAGDATPLVMIPFTPWGHLEHDWEYPEYRRWLEQLGAGRALIRYDARGLGLSQLFPASLSGQAQSEDLEAVMRAARVRVADLFVGPDSGPTAFLYAARAGNTIRRMVLHMTWLDGSVLRSGMDGSGFRQMMRADWDAYCLTTSQLVLGYGASQDVVRRHAAWLQLAPRDVVENFYLEEVASDVTAVAQTVAGPPILALCVCKSNPVGPVLTHLHDYAAEFANVRLVEVAADFAPWGMLYQNWIAVVRSFLDAPDEDVAPGGGWEPPAHALA